MSDFRPKRAQDETCFSRPNWPSEPARPSSHARSTSLAVFFCFLLHACTARWPKMARFFFFLFCHANHVMQEPCKLVLLPHLKLQPTSQAINGSFSLQYKLQTAAPITSSTLHFCPLSRPCESPAKREPACFFPSQLAPSLSDHVFRARLLQTASPVNHHGSSSRFLHHLEPPMDNPTHQMAFVAEHQSQPHHICITSQVSIQLAPAYMEAADSWSAGLRSPH